MSQLSQRGKVWDESANYTEKALVEHNDTMSSETQGTVEQLQRMYGEKTSNSTKSEPFTMTIFRARELEALLEPEGYTLNLERVEFDGGTSATLDTFFHGLGGTVNEPVDVLCTINGLNGTYLASELWEIYWTEDMERLVLYLDDRWIEASADRWE